VSRRRVVVSAALTVFLLWVFLRQAHGPDLLRELGNLQPTYIAAAVAVSLLEFVYRAVRWRWLLEDVGKVRFRSALECSYMGWAVTTLLPARMGEVARPVLIARREPVSPSFALGTVVLEKVLDAVSLLVLLAIYLAFFPFAFTSDGDAPALVAALRTGGRLVLLALLVAVGAMATVRRYQGGLGRVLERTVGTLPRASADRLRGIASSFLAGAGRLRTARSALLAGLHTTVVWALACGKHVLLFKAFGMQLPPYAVIPLLTLIVFGTLVPTPAAIGSYHKAVQIALTVLLAQPIAVATSYAIVAHAVVYVPSGVIGMILLAREGVSFTALRFHRAGFAVESRADMREVSP
jgi:hypothetical protein